MECSIINPALSLLMKHLLISQRQKGPNFAAFHWSPHGSLASIGQQCVATRVVHLPNQIKTSLITEADQITKSDQAVRAVHSCNSWLYQVFKLSFDYHLIEKNCKIGFGIVNILTLHFV